MPIDSGNLALKGLDDLFSTEENRQEEQREQVQQIPVDALHPFTNHPFKVLDDEAMTRTVESIAQYGVLAPPIARPRPEGGYEIISGHRRQYAAKLAGLDTPPVIVRQMADDAAVILMVDSNLQREHILPSERALAYKMKLEALKNQGARSDLTSCQVGTKLRTDEQIAENANESARQIQRYIRLTYLISEFLEKMDRNEIALSVGVELSFLDESCQREVLEQCAINDCTPSYSQAWRMHKADREGTLTTAVIQAIMSEEKANQREMVKVPTSRLREVLPQGLDANKTEAFIIKACDHYRKYLVRQRNREER